MADGAKLYLEPEMGIATTTLATREQASDLDALHLQEPFLEPHWYAAYTCANHEKRSSTEIAQDFERRVSRAAGTFQHYRGFLALALFSAISSESRLNDRASPY